WASELAVGWTRRPSPARPRPRRPDTSPLRQRRPVRHYSMNGCLWCSTPQCGSAREYEEVRPRCRRGASAEGWLKARPFRPGVRGLGRPGGRPGLRIDGSWSVDAHEQVVGVDLAVLTAEQDLDTAIDGGPVGGEHRPAQQDGVAGVDALVVCEPKAVGGDVLVIDLADQPGDLIRALQGRVDRC